jgi:dipeptidyl aminopeptidase/acylaminoacyl peptidase
MKCNPNSAKSLLVGIVSLAALAGLPAPALSQWKPSTPPLPVSKIIEDWPLRGVAISPDGKHIAGIAGLPGRNPIIKIWKTDDLSATPMAIDSKSMRFTSVTFVKNDRLYITANQPVERGTESRWLSKVVITDLEGKFFEEPLSSAGTVARVGLVSRLASDPDNILLQYASNDLTLDLVKYNVRTKRVQRMARGGDLEDYVGGGVDRNGEPRIKTELKPENGTWVQYLYYKDDSGNWVEQRAFRSDIASRKSIGLLRLTADGSKAYVSTNAGGTNFNTINSWDFKTQTLSEPLFQNTEFDATGIVFWQPIDEADEIPNADVPVAGYCFDGPSVECIYTDPILKRIEARLKRSLPGRTLSITARQGGNTVLVRATGPNFPDTWYIFKGERQLIRIGSVIEDVDPATLGSAQWVTYKARDGLEIPAIVYLPPNYDAKRDGRIPLVVMPHGGPWARDDMDYDTSHWSQMFATRGFAVLQPQYRGSDGLGRKLWLAGDKEWGAKMQDDKDDGAKWLVDQGVADPARMMMYGYSYGGFAAAAAAARSGGASKGLYQCAISGAPVIDMDRLRENEWGENRISRKAQGDTVRGWNPQAHLDQVEIPWLIFHGDYDRQADTVYSRSAAARMRQLNKPNFKYVEIKKMAHTLNEMTPDMRNQFIPLILDWTSTNCGNISATFKEPGLKTTPAKRASK